MNRLIPIFLAALPLGARDAAQLELDLVRIARVATVMVDGDVCQRIVTPRALTSMLHPDPRDHFSSGDNYDVDDASFIAIKKTLMRLAILAHEPVDMNLWMPLPANPPRIQIVIRNRYEMSQFWEWGALDQPSIPAMRTVLDSGRPVTVKQKPGFVSVLAPIRNSLGDVVGLVEAVARLQPDPRENVK